METSELPVMDEQEESAPWQEQDEELAALRLWREASRLDSASDEGSPTGEE